MVGSVSLVETVEFLYWILRSGYSGWYLMDVFPYREDGLRAIQQCVSNTERLLDAARRLQKTDLAGALEKMDAVASLQALWDSLLK